MEEKKAKIFTEGLMFKLPRDGAPEFVKGSLSVKVEEFKAFLDEHVSNAGWVNIDLKVGQSGKAYAELNQFVPQKPSNFSKDDGIPYPKEEEDDSSLIPF